MMGTNPGARRAHLSILHSPFLPGQLPSCPVSNIHNVSQNLQFFLSFVPACSIRYVAMGRLPLLAKLACFRAYFVFPRWLP